MRYPLSFTLFISLLAGCASWPEGSDYGELPAATPFDNNPLQRAAYLDAYQEGFRSASEDGTKSKDFIRGPHGFAQELGWRAGASQAIAHPR